MKKLDSVPLQISEDHHHTQQCRLLLFLTLRGWDKGVYDCTWQTSSSAFLSSSTNSPSAGPPALPEPRTSLSLPAAQLAETAPSVPLQLLLLDAAGSIPASRMHSAVSSIAERHSAKASSKAGGGGCWAAAAAMESWESEPIAAGGDGRWTERRRASAFEAFEATLYSITAK